MKIRAPLRAIEQARNSRVLVLATTHLEIGLLPTLYETLRDIGRVERLDVVLHGRGGDVHAARRIALLLHQFTEHLAFIVPYHCESAATITTLAGHEIIAGPVAVFSPIDPHLQVAVGGSSGGPPAISVQDIRLFSEMCRDWFAVDESEAKHRAMSVLCENIFPTALTSFYRSSLEIQLICAEILALATPAMPAEVRDRIISSLLFGHHSHSYPLTRDELDALGLPMTREPATEDLAWEISRIVQSTVGGGVRPTDEDDWLDVVFASTQGMKRRRRSVSGLEPVWEAGEIE